eukprot:scaffold4941_cov132-Isochrysis_galbana.AAC.1
MSCNNHGMGQAGGSFEGIDASVRVGGACVRACAQSSREQGVQRHRHEQSDEVVGGRGYEVIWPHLLGERVERVRPLPEIGQLENSCGASKWMSQASVRKLSYSPSNNYSPGGIIYSPSPCLKVVPQPNAYLGPPSPVPGERKSGMPAETEIPAPHSTIIDRGGADRRVSAKPSRSKEGR